MEQHELIKLIRSVMRQELAASMMGKITATTGEFRGTAQRFSSETPIPNQRLISSYGLASRPKAGTECVVSPINNDPTHLGILGCNDTGRPTVQDGEVSLYGPDGQQIYLKNGGTIHQGAQGADEPVVLGNVLKEFLTKVIDEFLNAPQIGYDSFGLPVELDPTIRLHFLQFKLTYLTTVSTNIVGQKNFVERGA